MDKKANDTFAFDLENRLDDFFSDSLPPQDETPADAHPAAKTDTALKDLKSTVLAIDWEITDDALEAFIFRIDGLVDRFKDDKVVSTFLKLLKSMGKYVRRHKSNAHPDTIKRIMAVYAALEESVTNESLSPAEKEKILLGEVRQFQRLKAKIVASRSPHPASGHSAPVQTGELSGIDALIRAIDELKSMMAAELSAIRKELGQLRQK
ncbi:hypothetical protein [Desulfosarcina sp.]|uniref:hypothetical protein n=1 Tax=Desulfosarcina sp. TaxID=2027861 RepID=UPI003970AB71